MGINIMHGPSPAVVGLAGYMGGKAAHNREEENRRFQLQRDQMAYQRQAMQNQQQFGQSLIHQNLGYMQQQNLATQHWLDQSSMEGYRQSNENARFDATQKQHWDQAALERQMRHEDRKAYIDAQNHRQDERIDSKNPGWIPGGPGDGGMRRDGGDQLALPPPANQNIGAGDGINGMGVGLGGLEEWPSSPIAPPLEDSGLLGSNQVPSKQNSFYTAYQDTLQRLRQTLSNA